MASEVLGQLLMGGDLRATLAILRRSRDTLGMLDLSGRSRDQPTRLRVDREYRRLEAAVLRAI